MITAQSLKPTRIILLATFILVPIANYIAAYTSGSGRFDDDATTLVDAAGYAFSIWGVIFLGMLLFSWFQFREDRPTQALKNAYRYLVLAGLASIAFVPISISNNQLLGTFDLLWHLAALIAANRALRAHVAEVGRPAYGWTYFAPSMYLGWISAATVIATALGLDQLGVSFSRPTAIVIATGLYIVLTLLGSFFATRRDPFYGLTVAWALVAVGVEQGASSVPALRRLGRGRRGTGGHRLVLVRPAEQRLLRYGGIRKAPHLRAVAQNTNKLNFR